MSDRAILLFLWFAFFVASLGAIVSYGLRHTSGGIVLLSDEDVVLGLQRIATIYGAYLGVILLAWFTRPVRPIVTLGTREFLSRVAIFSRRWISPPTSTRRSWSPYGSALSSHRR
jgi:hypothetical protein